MAAQQPEGPQPGTERTAGGTSTRDRKKSRRAGITERSRKAGITERSRRKVYIPRKSRKEVYIPRKSRNGIPHREEQRGYTTPGGAGRRCIPRKSREEVYTQEEQGGGGPVYQGKSREEEDRYTRRGAGYTHLGTPPGTACG